ncbi:MAG: hypothetical protein M1819_000271 [Sarea resinae]|nr:MAG: hypothetical protein M1819_000271 [Sarea resinae]
MSKEILRRSLAASACLRCQTTFMSRSLSARTFTSTARRRADEESKSTTSPISSVNEPANVTAEPEKSAARSSQEGLSDIFARPARTDRSASPSLSEPQDLANLSKAFGDLGTGRSSTQQTQQGRFSAPSDLLSDALNFDLSAFDTAKSIPSQKPPHRFHIYAHKHNTHLTLAKANGDSIISVSAGNIGFKKSQRGSYDCAYQLAAYVMKRIQEQGLLGEISRLELVLKGFGKGREAVTKAIMGSEGRNIRGRICRVTDATKLKFGGPRSPKPRRLG